MYFSRAGIYRGLSKDRKSLQVDADWYPLAPGMRVYTENSSFSSIGLIPAGRDVGLSLENTKDGGTRVTGVWRLPAGTITNDAQRHGLRVR
jgi:hypothetical protein